MTMARTARAETKPRTRSSSGLPRLVCSPDCDQKLFFLIVLPPFIYITNVYHHKYFASLFLMSYTPALLFFCAQHFNTLPVIQKTIEAAGNMTYSSYLIHFPLQLVIALYFLNTEQKIPYYSTVFFVGFIFVTLVLSYYIYRLFELPAQNFIRRKLA